MHIEGEARIGGEITFRFGGPDRFITMESLELAPPSLVVWRCVQGPAEWHDTTVTFDLRSDGAGLLVFDETATMNATAAALVVDTVGWSDDDKTRYATEHRDGWDFHLGRLGKLFPESTAAEHLG